MRRALLCLTASLLAAGEAPAPAEKPAPPAAPAAPQPPMSVDGTDPTEIRQRLEVELGWVDQPAGGRWMGVTANYEHPLSPRLLVGGRWGLASEDREVDDASGTTDAIGRIGWLAYGTAKGRVLLDAEVGLPFASDDLLGTGKVTVAPGIIASVPMPTISSRFQPAYHYRRSLFGDSDRPDVRRSEIELPVVTSWDLNGKAAWTTANPRIVINHEADDAAGMAVDGEAGVLLKPKLGIYGRVGLGVAGKGVVDEDFSLVVGGRFLF